MLYDEKIVHDEFFDESQKQKPYKKGIHPVELFLNGNLDARSDVLLTHPDVIGFLFVHEDIITEVYLPKKVVTFEATASETRKSIVAVSGTCSEYTFFSVSEEILLSNVFHITDCDKFIKIFPTYNITKFAKENKSNLQEEYKEIVKAKNLLWLACRTFFLSLQEI